MNILVSACLLGMPCRYDGKSMPNAAVIALKSRHNLIPICPEQAGGLPTPRIPAERLGNAVFNREGAEVTEAYQKGAETALKLAQKYHCRYAILKEKSPSCGHGIIYDGTFTGKRVAGNGVTTELLASHGILVFGESQLSPLPKEFL